MSSATPSRTQQVLIYFGLAEDPNAAAEQRSARDATWLVVMSLCVSVWLWGERDHIVALVIGVLLLPALVIAAGTKLRSGSAAREFCDRHVGVAETLAVPVMVCGLAWLIIPSDQSDWIPIAIGIGVALLSLASTAAERFRARRR